MWLGEKNNQQTKPGRSKVFANTFTRKLFIFGAFFFPPDKCPAKAFLSDTEVLQDSVTIHATGTAFHFNGLLNRMRDRLWDYITGKTVVAFGMKSLPSSDPRIAVHVRPITWRFDRVWSESILHLNHVCTPPSFLPNICLAITPKRACRPHTVLLRPRPLRGRCTWAKCVPAAWCTHTLRQ